MALNFLTYLLADKSDAFCGDAWTRRNADCSIRVGGQTFHCHRLVIQLASSHIQSLLDNTVNDDDKRRTPTIDLDQTEVTARAFEYVVRFAYGGSVELDASVVGDVMTAADALCVPHLRAACVEFMTRSLCPDNALRYLTYLETYDVAVSDEQKLYKQCRDVARNTFWRAANSSRLLAGATDAVVEMLLKDNNLWVCIRSASGRTNEMGVSVPCEHLTGELTT